MKKSLDASLTSHSCLYLLHFISWLVLKVQKVQNEKNISKNCFFFVFFTWYFSARRLITSIHFLKIPCAFDGTGRDGTRDRAFAAYTPTETHTHRNARTHVYTPASSPFLGEGTASAGFTVCAPELVFSVVWTPLPWRRWERWTWLPSSFTWKKWIKVYMSWKLK